MIAGTVRSAPLSAQQIAELLETVAAAGSRLRLVLDAAAAGEYPVSVATIRDFEQLLIDLRPAAECRAVLDTLDVDDLLRGAEAWAERRQTLQLRLVAGDRT